ncbi:hypothetical protein FAI41_06155 [Acetobacteraceae bacterium]|nr:hypothetical protein FAI41_06155 [Acetobacteraceae bacterium]
MGGRRKDPRSKIIDKSFEVPADPPQGFLSKDYFLSCFAFEKHDRKCQLNNFFHENLAEFSINTDFYRECELLYELRTSLPTLQIHPDANRVADRLMIQANWKAFSWIALFGLNPMEGEGLINSTMGTSRLLLPMDRQGNTSLPHYIPDDFITICHEIILRLKENFFPIEDKEGKAEATKTGDGQLFCTILTSPRIERWMATSCSESGISIKQTLKDWGYQNGVKLHIRLSPALRETGMFENDLILFALPDIPDIIGDGNLHAMPHQNSPVNEIGTSKIKIHATKQEGKTILRKMEWQVTAGWNIVSWGNAVMEIPVTDKILPLEENPAATGFKG